MSISQNLLKRFGAGFIALVMLTFGWSGMVLCVGADGHLAFEFPHEGHCEDAHHADEHEHDTPVEGGVAESSPCAADCVDVLLFQNTLSHLVKDIEIEGIFKGGAFQPLIIMDSLYPCANIQLTMALTSRGSPPTLGRSPNLVALRTIILRV